MNFVRRPNPNDPKPGIVSYSNKNFTFSGLIIEEITGNSAEAEIRRQILEHCGVKFTYLEGFEGPSRGPEIAGRY